MPHGDYRHLITLKGRLYIYIYISQIAALIALVIDVRPQETVVCMSMRQEFRQGSAMAVTESIECSLVCSHGMSSTTKVSRVIYSATRYSMRHPSTFPKDR